MSLVLPNRKKTKIADLKENLGFSLGNLKILLEIDNTADILLEN